MAEHDKCSCNLHEQFASAVDLQELFALTVDKKKDIALLYQYIVKPHKRFSGLNAYTQIK